MTPREQEEYRALRETIRERGTARVWIFVAGIVAWAGFVIATAALAALPIATLLPLLVLGAIFEAVFSLHTGVERIGRYVQVFVEDATGWEQTAMAYGRAYPGSGSDPLFTAVFLIAAFLNFVPVLVAEPVPMEVGVIGTVHALFIARVFVARRAAGRQRALDLERFQAIKNSP
jgi:hypothetical protein